MSNNQSPAEQPPPDAIAVVLKWSKRLFDNNQLNIRPGSSADAFKKQVCSLTGVPVERQKLLCKHAWKGTLRDGTVFDEHLSLSSGQTSLTVTLIGSAETLPEPPTIKTKFMEDLTPAELEAAAVARNEAALADAEGMIVALQLPPQYRNDGKMELYQYNRLVTGLPQREIEDMLRQQQQKGTLLGKVVMTLGLELRRAYVNDLAVLDDDGTLVSGLDDGHIQMWRHGEMVRDVIHEGVVNSGGGVDCLVSLAPSKQQYDLAFATGGRGCLRLWTDDGDCVRAFSSPAGTSPASIVSMQLGNDSSPSHNILCIAESFRITRYSDPNQFRLVPQDEEGRRRRADARAHEAAMQEGLARVSRSVRVWCLTGGGGTEWQPLLLEPEDGAGAAAVSALAVLPDSNDGGTVLVCGDEQGGLRLWRSEVLKNNNDDVRWEQLKLLQIHSSEGASSVVCMEPLPDRLLAVSTKVNLLHHHLPLAGSMGLHVPHSNAVYIIDVDKCVVKLVLNGHQDTVQCICSLPDGSLATGGGKLDATVRVWDHSQLSSRKKEEDSTSSDDGGAVPLVLTEATKLEEVGYVFALTVLPDAKPKSRHFALAAARYNVIKICL